MNIQILRLAWLNFKNSFKSYLSLILSLAFTILVFFNFQNIIYSDVFVLLGQRNKDYIDMLIEVCLVVLLCFLFFFLWYATNVFLTRRKREIGIYIFMGMSNRKIGSLYLVEISFVGITALAMGIGFGVLFSALFQMIMGAVSDLAVDVRFGISAKAIKMTSVSFLCMYLFFALKGFWNITRSSVLNMIMAAKQNEYLHVKPIVLLLKAILGIGVLVLGYYYANKGSRYDTLTNALLAVILVIIGVYLLFGGLIPLVFQLLVSRKRFLYHGQRCLWVNQTIFRMRKNYRTYAMVCIMGICSVSALATGFAMRNRYENLVAFDNQYTFQFLSSQSNIAQTTEAILDGKCTVAYQSSLCALVADSEPLLSSYTDVQQMHLLLSYSDIVQAAKAAGVTFAFDEPANDEVYYLSHLVLLSFITNGEAEPVTIAGKTYRQTQRIMIPYLGYLQKELGCLYVVSDREYERLKEKNDLIYYICNYKLKDDDVFNFEEIRMAFDTIVSNTEENYTARVSIDPYSNEGEWIKALHSLCIFMFLVFIVASGCIMFMKLYNDSFEEIQRYAVLKKLGFSTETLSASIAHELATAYLLPFAVMTVSAYFSVLSLGKMMRADLFSVYVVSMAVVSVMFMLFCVLSITVCQKTLLFARDNR